MNQLNIFLSLLAVLLIMQMAFAIIFKKRKAELFVSNERTRLTKEFLINFGRRIKVAWTLFFVLALSFSLGKFGITILFFLISFLALREFISILNMRPADYWPLFFSFYVFLPLQYFFALADTQFLFYIFIPVYVFLMGPLLSVIAASDDRQFFERAAKFQWAQIACVYCLSYAPAIAALELSGGSFKSTNLLLYLLIVIFFSDAFQYFFGNMYGKRKISAKLSPNKTWEGAIGGVLVATIAGTLLHTLTPFKWWEASLICLLISSVGFLGGLVMSGIKRSLKIKDWGDVLGAHGGVLDRLDSFVFTAPLFYHLCKYFYP